MGNDTQGTAIATGMNKASIDRTSAVINQKDILSKNYANYVVTADNLDQATNQKDGFEAYVKAKETKATLTADVDAAKTEITKAFAALLGNAPTRKTEIDASKAALFAANKADFISNINKIYPK